jgi:hypothetical protein
MDNPFMVKRERASEDMKQECFKRFAVIDAEAKALYDTDGLYSARIARAFILQFTAELKVREELTRDEVNDMYSRVSSALNNAKFSAGLPSRIDGLLSFGYVSGEWLNLLELIEKSETCDRVCK